jgi:hypothetical protein
VNLDRIDTDDQLPGDLLIAGPGHNQLQNLELTFA